MSAPLSIGELDGCIVACPLHEGRFDLATGDPAQMPTTGGLDPDGVYHPTWSPGRPRRQGDPPGKKAEARRLTRVRRFRYYPVRVVDGRIEVALPDGPEASASCRRRRIRSPASRDPTRRHPSTVGRPPGCGLDELHGLVGVVGHLQQLQVRRVDGARRAAACRAIQSSSPAQ